MRQVISPYADIRITSYPQAVVVTQALYGEDVDILDVVDQKWARVVTRADHYQGFVLRSALGTLPKPTHRVRMRQTPVRAFPYQSGKIKTRIGMNALVAATPRARETTRQTKHWVLVKGLGWVARRSLMPIAEYEMDWVAVAERYLGTPYYWGGRDGASGIDCSGVIQNALSACGISSPRDSKDMLVKLGESVLIADKRRRGDIVFFKGHVGVMLDSYTILHASVRRNQVIKEPLQDLIEAFNNQEPGSGAILAVRRIL